MQHRRRFEKYGQFFKPILFHFMFFTLLYFLNYFWFFFFILCSLFWEHYFENLNLLENRHLIFSFSNIIIAENIKKEHICYLFTIYLHSKKKNGEKLCWNFYLSLINANNISAHIQQSSIKLMASFKRCSSNYVVKRGSRIWNLFFRIFFYSSHSFF